MNASLYPVPAEERVLEPLLNWFLTNKVEPGALEPDNLYLIVLLGSGDNVRSVEQTANTLVEEHNNRTQVADELGQITTVSIDERRLNTFTVSLLYNLLELDQTAPVADTISRDRIPDEDVRKIDYYLEKVNEYFANEVNQQEDVFEEKLNALFPVYLDDTNTSDLHTTFEDRLAASANARIDYLLLAKAASEETDRCLQFFKTARQRDLDSNTYMSPSSGSGGGYTRIVEYGYDKRDDDFRSQFNTAIQKVEKADTLDFRTKLSQLSSNSTLETVYSDRPALLRLITGRYTGSASEMADLLVRTVNTIQAIHQNEGVIDKAYAESKSELESSIDQLESVYDELEEHSKTFPSGKIKSGPSIVDDFREVVRVAGRVTAPSAKFVFGYNRQGRSSLFATLAENIDTRRHELESRENDLNSHVRQLNSLEDRLQTKLDDIDSAYQTIQTGTVSIDLPEKKRLKDSFKSECNTMIEDVKSDLPGLDFSKDADSLRETQDQWDEILTDLRHDVEELFEHIDGLTKLADRVRELETERSDLREELRSLTELVRDTNE